VARHVDPTNTVSGPFLVPPVDTGVSFYILSNNSYFKFNLDYMSFYQLVGRQDNSDNRSAYVILRNYTATHQNAFFNMVDRALRGPDPARDAETLMLLDQWLQRPNRDFYVDDSLQVPVCGSDACSPIPVPLRPPATFLWEVSPFQLKGGGRGVVENAGIDYLLPYWMARYYGVTGSGSHIQSAAAPGNAIAPGSLASLYGANLAAVTAKAGSLPLPLSLGGVMLSVTDSAGAQRIAPLYYVSAGQINFVLPDNVAPGTATVTVTGSGAPQSFTAAVQTVAPALFSMSGTGSGVAAATALSVQPANPQLQSPVAVFQCGNNGCVPTPIPLGIDRPIYVSFYGTGIRNSVLADVIVTIGGIHLQALYAGPAPNYIGLDQVNVQLPLLLRGRGEVDVSLTVNGQISNTVTIQIQ